MKKRGFLLCTLSVVLCLLLLVSQGCNRALDTTELTNITNNTTVTDIMDSSTSANITNNTTVTDIMDSSTSANITNNTMVTERDIMDSSTLTNIANNTTVTERDKVDSSTSTNITNNTTVTQRDTNVVLIGNSLIYAGDIPYSLEAAAKFGKDNINVVNLTESGFTLGQHVEKLKDSKYDSVFYNADIVIFQEYGAPNKNTENNLKILMSRFNSNAKLYFLLTEFDVEIDREDELRDISGITFIPSGYVHENLIDKGFKYSQFHASNDYHPNQLYGYIAALTIYSVLFDKPIDDIPYNYLNRISMNNLYNPTKQTKCGDKKSKDDCMREIKEVIKKTVEDYQKKG